MIKNLQFALKNSSGYIQNLSFVHEKKRASNFVLESLSFFFTRNRRMDIIDIRK